MHTVTHTLMLYFELQFCSVFTHAINDCFNMHIAVSRKYTEQHCNKAIPAFNLCAQGVMGSKVSYC